MRAPAKLSKRSVSTSGATLKSSRTLCSRAPTSRRSSTRPAGTIPTRSTAATRNSNACWSEPSFARCLRSPSRHPPSNRGRFTLRRAGSVPAPTILCWRETVLSQRPHRHRQSHNGVSSARSERFIGVSRNIVPEPHRRPASPRSPARGLTIHAAAPVLELRARRLQLGMPQRATRLCAARTRTDLPRGAPDESEDVRADSSRRVGSRGM